MTIRQQFLYQTADGQPAITLLDWIATLPNYQQEEFFDARSRQLEYRQQCVDSGLLVVDTSGPVHDYIWRDEEAAKNGKPADPVWLAYFERYLTENNLKFSIIESN